jgi:cytochrome b pre-mRNA-processing protein 3
MFWKRFFKTDGRVMAAGSLYAAIVAQARQPVFYEKLAIPDTIDGRFDLLILHAVLVADRLGAEATPAARDFAQILIDEMFQALELNLRESGVGDLSIPKRMKKMAEAYHGRAGAYRVALRVGDRVGLEAALARNIWPDGAPGGAPARLAAYVGKVVASLAQSPAQALMAGELRFPDCEGI